MKQFIAKWQQKKIAELELCPLPTQLTPLEKGRILVVAPHADDETLGCGGTLALLRKKECQIKVVFVTNSNGAGSLGKDAITIRRRESVAALAILGIDDIEFLNEPDGNFRNSARFENKINDLLQHFSPNWLFLPSVLDYHRDHVAIGQAVLSCWHSNKTPCRAFIYEIWCPLPATKIVDISSVIGLKKQAIACYELPLSHCDYLSASIGLASYRGLYLAKKEDTNYAEAFFEAEKKPVWGNLSQRMLGLRVYLEKLLKK